MVALRNIDTPERGVLLLDKDHRITFANKRASDIFRTSLDDLIGAQLPEAVTHRSMTPNEVVEEVLESWYGPGAVFHRYSTPLYSSGGEVAGRVEIYSDITARRLLEKEILERNSELFELNIQLEDAQEQLVHSERLRTLGEMAAGVAHDINNVLGIILGNAQLARRKIGDDGRVMQSIDAIELAARDAAETVRRLREIGKPVDSAGYVPVDLGAIVEDVMRGVVPAWQESGSGVAAKISVGKCLGKDCIVIGNATELREALGNILLNAAQAIEESGSIEISTMREDGWVLLTVRDDGVGMSEETCERLFDPFFTTRGAQGTGLGMSMVDAIAIRHHAKISVESKEGVGTAITIRFPALH